MRALTLLVAAALAAWVLPRLVAERRLAARLARPVPPWPLVPLRDPA